MRKTWAETAVRWRALLGEIEPLVWLGLSLLGGCL